MISLFLNDFLRYLLLYVSG